ncbi:nicotinamide N-methyltransferase-like [Hyla sarda]|uniref:nicotinamide N-methyltransferase-like n=1 Tax=Hyla sarda TaxID=327740 RepID=UPI0024C2983B|nr:nicotinamide N-methyltransferase-like [Hyla sarda]
MDTSTSKVYHVDGYDSRQYLEHYFSDKPDLTFKDDTLIFPIENLTKIFKKGHIKGDLMIDLSTGSMIHYLLPSCEFFKRILVLKVKDRCILELKRWLDTRTGAFNWGHAAKLHVDIAGNSDQLQDTEEKLKSAVEHVVKCNLAKENMTDPIVLPPADCIISAWLLDNVCKNQDDYIRYLRKMSKLLKPGGHLILIGCLEISYYTVGKDKLHAFSYDEDFARKALGEVGFVIDDCKVKKRKAQSDLADYKAIIFIAAHKVK